MRVLAKTKQCIMGVHCDITAMWCNSFGESAFPPRIQPVCTVSDSNAHS